MNRGLFGLPARRAWSDTQPPGGVIPQGGWSEIIGNQNGSAAFTLNREMIIRFDLWYPTRIHYIGLQITTAGTESAVVFQGLRPMMMDGWPGSLIVEQVISVTSTGSKWASMNVDLPPGRYCVCSMANGWTTTAPQFRSTLTDSDSGANPYSMPHTAVFPQSRATGLPGAGGRGHMAAFRATDGTGLTRSPVRDWSASIRPPATYIDGEALVS